MRSDNLHCDTECCSLHTSVNMDVLQDLRVCSCTGASLEPWQARCLLGDDCADSPGAAPAQCAVCGGALQLQNEAHMVVLVMLACNCRRSMRVRTACHKLPAGTSNASTKLMVPMNSSKQLYCIRCDCVMSMLHQSAAYSCETQPLKLHPHVLLRHADLARRRQCKCCTRLLWVWCRLSCVLCNAVTPVMIKPAKAC
jgi:hypothetical protein